MIILPIRVVLCESPWPRILEQFDVHVRPQTVIILPGRMAHKLAVNIVPIECSRQRVNGDYIAGHSGCILFVTSQVERITCY